MGLGFSGYREESERRAEAEDRSLINLGPEREERSNPRAGQTVVVGALYRAVELEGRVVLITVTEDE